MKTTTLEVNLRALFASGRRASLGVLLGVGVLQAQPSWAAEEPTASDIGNAVTELDTERAREYLKRATTGGPALDFQRARLAIYVGDCDSGEAILDSLSDQPEATNLGALARSCARATAGSTIAEDAEAGVWIRLQDRGDLALVPELVRVAVAARQTMKDDLGVELPRPLRIDLVRDLYSLAAVSGLPLEAAETTGTVAVARWGRVTMLSPRAAQHGYPWEDTLAHEITHLALSRGSRDFAPLWLQEGIAKREETRWRPKRPFDGQRDANQIARRALLEGKSVGIDQIGPSIAMLPSPEAAGISYAEVESFMGFWIERNGRAAFGLLLADLKGLQSREADDVMASITGFPLRYWIHRWQEHLRSLPEASGPVSSQDGDVRQAYRLGELLAAREHWAEAQTYFDGAVRAAGGQGIIRHRRAAAQLATGQSPERVLSDLGEVDQLSALNGAWLGLHGQLLSVVQKLDQAEASLRLGLAIDPYAPDVACDNPRLGHHVGPTLPSDAPRERLCVEARKLVGD